MKPQAIVTRQTKTIYTVEERITQKLLLSTTEEAWDEVTPFHYRLKPGYEIRGIDLVGDWHIALEMGDDYYKPVMFRPVNTEDRVEAVQITNSPNEKFDFMLGSIEKGKPYNVKNFVSGCGLEYIKTMMCVKSKEGVVYVFDHNDLYRMGFFNKEGVLAIALG